MRAWDSVTRGGSLRPGPAAFAIILAGALVSLAPVSRRIEVAYYDLIQGLQARSGSTQIVLVDTGGMTEGAATLWEAGTFPELLNALAQAGARLVIPVEPLQSTMSIPDSAQLAALAKLEQRSRPEVPTEASPQGDPLQDAFGQQLAELRDRSELHARTVRVAASMRNLIVAVPTFDQAPGTNTSATNCLKHAIDADFPMDGMDITAVTRRVRAVAPPPDSLCQAILGAGHAEFWADADGLVRRIDLLVNASGTLVPSAALRATLPFDLPSGKRPTVSRTRISWDDQTIRTTDGSTALVRFYSPRNAEPAFETIAARDVMDSSEVADRVNGRIAVLGDIGIDVEPSYATPVADRTPAATLLATGLSNLLEGDYLTRPAWLSWLENLALVLIGAAILVWGARITPIQAIVAGIGAATLLIATETCLVLLGGIWTQLVTPAVFAVFSASAIRFLQPRRVPGPAQQPVLAPTPAVTPAQPATRIANENDLDLAFSMLRHQAPNEHVKKRLYDLALEHARHRDLAKAERVLRHLASLDPDYRNAAEKLKKLAGLRNAAPQPAPAAEAKSLRPVLQPLREPGNLSGQTIGRYEIDQPIGHGAMATVYLGKDPKINRQVAIKTIALAEEFSDTDLVNARTQFLREAESAGRLNHPTIISIYDAGEDGQVAYLAMEYFRGKPLSHYAQQGSLLPPQKVFELMARAAEALHYAHGQHVVHRDVKPANLLYDADTDALKITDFGIARLTDSSRTKTGIILGTPSYMSPEQLAGTSVTGQSDLFSLGVTLYQLLAGMPPFRADSIPMLMQKIAHEHHEPVSRLRDDLPACADGILDQALAKDPADRYASGRAMALALRDCCSTFATPAEVHP